VAALRGPFSAVYGIQSFKGQTFDFQVTVNDDPAALHDGDTYALTIQDGTVVLASWSGPAPYQTTFLNGTQCDAFPCRHASVQVH
jgi:hypothetical protein